MSITGSLFSAVSGLKAQSQSMSIISDNIANASTVGYKGSKAQFETLVTSGATRTTYSSGGVLPRPGAMVDTQGLINASASATDVAIQGRGFFAVTDSLNVRQNGTLSGSAARAYTRAGSFTVNKDGVLVNSAGFALLGVPTSTTGVPTTSNPSILGLVPVTVGNITGSSSPTTELKLGANLPAVTNAPSKLSLAATVDVNSAIQAQATYTYNQTIYASSTNTNSNTSTTTNTGTGINVVTATGYTATTTLPSAMTGTGAASALAFLQTGNTVYSSTGKPYSIDLTYVKTGINTYAVMLQRPTDITSLSGSPSLGIPTPGFPITLATVTVSTTGLPSTVTNGTSLSFADGSTFVPNVDASNFTAGASGSNRFGRVEVDAQQVSTVVYDSLGVAHNLTLEFSRNQTNNGTSINSNTARDWTVKILNMTVASTGAQSVTFPLSTGATGFPIYLDGTDATGTAPTVAQFSQTGLRFNSDGTLSSQAPAFLPSLPLVTGANNFGGATFKLNLGTTGSKAGLTSQSDEFAVSFIQQNGIPYGSKSGVEIDGAGLVRITFTNGQSLPVYKLPVVTFADPNQLQAESGNIYSETIDSGSALPNYAGIGGSGTVSPASLEASTVDISEEFTNMIVTQRSYSANARTITTADEMLQEVLNIKR